MSEKMETPPRSLRTIWAVAAAVAVVLVAVTVFDLGCPPTDAPRPGEVEPEEARQAQQTPESFEVVEFFEPVEPTGQMGEEPLRWRATELRREAVVAEATVTREGPVAGEMTTRESAEFEPGEVEEWVSWEEEEYVEELASRSFEGEPQEGEDEDAGEVDELEAMEAAEAALVSAQESFADFREHLEVANLSPELELAEYFAIALEQSSQTLRWLTTELDAVARTANSEMEDHDEDVVAEGEELSVWMETALWVRELQEGYFPELVELVDRLEEAAEKLDPEVSEEDQAEALRAYYEILEEALAKMVGEEEEGSVNDARSADAPGFARGRFDDYRVRSLRGARG